MKSDALGLSNNYSLKLSSIENDDLSYTHYRYKMYYKDTPIEPGTFYVHVYNGSVTSANGEYALFNFLDILPSISRETAFQTALHHAQINSVDDACSIEFELMKSAGFLVLLQIKEQKKLAWKFELIEVAPVTKNAYVYIDALSGEYLQEENLIHYINYPLNVPSIYSGIVPIICDKTSSNVYFLNEAGRKINTRSYYKTFGGSYFISEVYSQDSLWNINSNLKAGVDVHFGLETSFDFFIQKFNRNSYDNLGHNINAYINYPYTTAPSYSSGSFHFPPKDNMNQLEQATLELVGHEYGHAVVKSSANLNTNSEAGGLTESFADIFGIAIDFYKNPTTANFVLGDRTKVNGVPDRDLANPFQYGHPYVYNGVNWVANSPYHIAGVQNYWFYLLVNGGMGTTNFGVNYQINAIGMEAALKIVYRTLTVYLSANSNYVAARTGSIQAATDLYGACSREVKEVTKAWYSLNVGGNYVDGVDAGTLISQTTLCNGSALNPINISINGSTYEWDFGDGTTSTLINPSHIYAQPGIYTISLIASGTSTCNTTDTTIIPNIIVNPNSNLVPPLCLPTKQSINGSVGIYRVQFADIDNYSSSSYSEGNQDFSCESFTTIHPGDNVEIIVTTSANTLENVTAWIDYNNDGDFTASEIVYESINQKMFHKGIVLTDSNPLLNTPLRMRIIDDYQQSISGPCASLLFGQSEDYRVTFVPVSSPPIVNFWGSDSIIPQGDSIQFFDLTMNSGALSWSFPGGTPSSSTLENPFVTYSTPGVYPVTLVVTTNFGTDSLTKTSYIHVTNTYTLCGSSIISNEIIGTIYDAGGPNGPVTGTSYCEFMIDPGCANSITINFSSIHLGPTDYITILNRGPFSPGWGNVVAVFSGSSTNATATVTGGKMLIQFSKNTTGVFNGFAATWTSEIFVDQPPIASFIPDSYTPPFRSPVRFENQSQGGDLDFIWDFGDGATSGTSNSIHEYDSAGTYVVTLIANNCLGSDTSSLTITVQEPPLMLVTTDTIDVTISCGDSITVPVMVYNNGLGDLLISENGYTNMDDTIHILAYTAYQTPSNFMNFFATELNQSFPKHTLTTFTHNDTNLIKQSLENKQVLFFPPVYNDPDTVYENFENIVTSFMQKGGNVVVFGGANSLGNNRLRAMNILSAKSIPAYTLTNISVLDTTDFLTENIPSTFTPFNYVVYPVNVANKYKKMLIVNAIDELLTYRNFGKGKGIYNGFNTYTSSNVILQQLLKNSVKSAQNRWPDWLLASPESDIIHPGDSSIAYFTIKPFKLTPGLHDAFIRINGNDTSNLSHEFVLRLNILSSPLLTFQDSCLDFGLVTVGDSLTKNIIIQNPGCDTLIITSISSTHPDFTIYADSFLLPIATGASFNVKFTPQTIGSYSDTLYFQTNIGIIPHCITGTGTIEPIIYFTDTILHLSHDVCGGSDSVGFWLHNTGGNYLHYSLTGGIVDLPRRILMNVYGVDLQNEYLNTINSIQQNFPNIILDTTSIINTYAFSPLLKNKDVVLFPRQETGVSYISPVSGSVRNFLNTGGNAVFLGMDFHTNIGSNPIIYSSGIFNGSDTADVSTGNSIVMDTTDWFVKM
ncbi:MAG: M4 family metallopeptidase [Bacteroidetes bacterium]|nr:M4 family metallopeptidase [Bacteroidota bacterium]